VLLTDHERRFVVAFVKELNHVVHSAATRAGFDYMDSTETALVNANNRLCERTNPVGMNFIGFNPKAGSMWDLLDPSNWFHNSVHPNEIGHAAIAAAAAQWFADNPNRHAPVAATAAPYEVQPMEKLFEWGFIRRCDPKGDTACTLDNWETDQRLRLVQQSILPLTVAIVGAWMIVIGPLGWAAEHDFSVTNLVLAALRWMRGRRH
jgi:hypothetical protein